MFVVSTFELASALSKKSIPILIFVLLLVAFPNRSTRTATEEIGVWVNSSDPSKLKIPNEASWAVIFQPDYIKPRLNLSLVLNWISLHKAQNPFNPFVNQSDIDTVTQDIMSMPASFYTNFWGIIFISEEHYRTHVAFADNVNTTWFGERLLGYPLYLSEVQSATHDQWMDEMFLRMVRGWYNYFHARGIKVGINANGGSTVDQWAVPNPRPNAHGIPDFFGWPAMNFISEHYDFVVNYAFTGDLADYQWTKKYLSEVVDVCFQNQTKFWQLTQIWNITDNIGYNANYWEPEAQALEIRNCLDRNMIMMPYYWRSPPLNETLATMQKATELHDNGAPYFETYVRGENLLTGYVGNTYGWVQLLAGHDVAVTNVVPTETLVGLGFSVEVNVTVANIGNSTETFNVTTYANATPIGAQQVTLPSGNSTTISFNWNTAGFTVGNYTISANAEPVPGENDTANNTYTDGTIQVIPELSFLLPVFMITALPAIAYERKRRMPRSS